MFCSRTKVGFVSIVSDSEKSSFRAPVFSARSVNLIIIRLALVSKKQDLSSKGLNLNVLS